MRVVKIHNYGAAENLSFDETAQPAPAPDEVLVKTAVAGINYADTMLRAGTYFTRPELPVVPGFEVAGTIEEIGADVKNLKIGQRVLAKMSSGGYAEYAVTKADQIVPIPDDLDFGTATALFVQGLTALGLLKNLQSGQTILIHAAAGGVGQLLVQFAKIKGAKVIGTASSAEKLEKVIGLGADAGINYTEADWTEQVLRATGGKGADVIIEMVGGDLGRENLKILAENGMMIIYGAATGQDFPISTFEVLTKNLTIKGYKLYNEAPENIAAYTDQLMTAISEGQIQVTVQEFPFDQAVEAHRAMEGRRTMGKVVLVV